MKLTKIKDLKTVYLNYCKITGITSDWNIPQLDATLIGFIEFLEANKKGLKNDNLL